MDDAQPAHDADIGLIEIDVTANLKLQQQAAWIDYCAIGGLITNDGMDLDESDGKIKEIRRITITQFSEMINVPRRTLHAWKTIIPDFGDRVRKRREELWPQARETAIFNRLYLIGMTGTGQSSVDALKVLAAHFSKLRLPTQPHEVEAGENLIELLNLGRKKNIVEGEIASDSRTSTPAN